MILTKKQSEKYLDIVRHGNMDDMFDFGYQVGTESWKVEEPKPTEHEHTDAWVKGLTACPICGVNKPTTEYKVIKLNLSIDGFLLLYIKPAFEKAMKEYAEQITDTTRVLADKKKSDVAINDGGMAKAPSSDRLKEK